jgi:hypothetical protein
MSPTTREKEEGIMPDEKPQATQAPPEDGQKESDTGPVGVIRIITHLNPIPGPGEGMLRFGYLIDVPLADSDMLSEFGKLMIEMGVKPNDVIPLPKNSGAIAREIFSSITELDGTASGASSTDKSKAATDDKITLSLRASIRTTLKRELAIWPNPKNCVACRSSIDSCLLNFGERNSFYGNWFVLTDDNNIVLQIGYIVSNVAESGVMIARVYDYNLALADGTIIRRTIAINAEDIVNDEYNLFCTPHQIVDIIENGAYLFSDEVDEDDEDDDDDDYPVDGR